MLALAALLLVGLVSTPPDANPAAPGLEIEVHTGRARLADANGVRALWVGGKRVERLETYVLLDVPAGTRATLTWSGRSSVTLVGPAVVEWLPDPHVQRLRAFQLTQAHLEARDGTLRIEWHGWATELQSGAASLRAKSEAELTGRVHAACSFRARPGQGTTWSAVSGDSFFLKSLLPAAQTPRM